MKNVKIVITDNRNKWKSNHIKTEIMRGFNSLPLYSKALVLLNVLLGIQISILNKDIIRY